LPSRVVSIYGRSDAELSPRSLGSADRWFKSGLRNQKLFCPNKFRVLRRHPNCQSALPQHRRGPDRRA